MVNGKNLVRSRLRGVHGAQPEGNLDEALYPEIEKVFDAFGSTPSGLSAEEAARRLGEYGPNSVTGQRAVRWGTYLVGAFNNAFILLLSALAAIAVLTKDFAAAAIISAMVFISAVLCVTQEFRSGKAAEKLHDLVQTTATVTREGMKREVAVDELVPGDVVHLSAGDMAPVVLFINGFTKGDWGQAFFFAISVAVGLTPEMLPMVVTANLARGAVNMSKKKVIVKRLHSIQNFGAMDVLCSDKTGTLTQDRVVVERHLDILGRDSEKVLQLAYLNSHYQTGLKNLLDVAILQHAEFQEGLHVATDYRLVDEIPFDFSRRRMSVAVETPQREELLVTKGAVEEMLRITRRVDVERRLVPLDGDLKDRAVSLAQDLNNKGFRVIAVGYRKFCLGKGPYSVADETEMILAGLMAFLDPPKESAAPAIRALTEHGVAVKILTGDNDAVARRVCEDVGITPGPILLGNEIEGMDDAALRDAVENTTVFAKVSPAQKARVIEIFKDCGHVVGFLGDGINDAPALREADIGISVNTAVDIAKESADIILLEKSLMVLEEGVLEGRRVFGNILNYIRMGTSSNFGNMLSVLGASAWLPFLPMQPVQLLARFNSWPGCCSRGGTLGSRPGSTFPLLAG